MRCFLQHSKYFLSSIYLYLYLFPSVIDTLSYRAMCAVHQIMLGCSIHSFELQMKCLLPQTSHISTEYQKLKHSTRTQHSLCCFCVRRSSKAMNTNQVNIYFKEMIRNIHNLVICLLIILDNVSCNKEYSAEIFPFKWIEQRAHVYSYRRFYFHISSREPIFACLCHGSYCCACFHSSENTPNKRYTEIALNKMHVFLLAIIKWK